jgi:hypothetical protein
MDDPSTTRSAAVIVVLLMAGIRQARKPPDRHPSANGDKATVHDLFFVRNMFF